MKRRADTKWRRRDLLRTVAGTSAIMPASLIARDTAVAIRGAGLSARDFGVTFDSRSDDGAALQRAVDAAAQQKRPLVLPSGTALLRTPLDLTGRKVAVLGDPNGQTVLRAGEPLSCLVAADEARDVIDSQLFLYGLTLDGAGVTTTGLRLRYRHRTMLDTLTVTRCEIGVDERDTWLGRRLNCLTRATAVGWRLRGANHSSIWQACSFIDARVAHLDIGGQGTAGDGNEALLFQGCDVEFGAGHGIVLAAGANATFDTCYIGEGIAGDVLRSAGTTLFRGGTLFIGYSATSTGVVPLGGRITIADSSVLGQRFGSLDRLAGCAETPADRSTGHVVFRDVSMQLMIGGNPVLAGDILGTLPMRVFAPLLGRAWLATASDATIVDASAGNEKRVRCDRVTSGNPVIGLAAPLRDTGDARRDGAAYLVIVYTATAPVELKFRGATSRLVGTLPATKEVSTYVKVDVPVEFARFTTVELTMRAGVGDELVLHHATISDVTVLEPGPVANLAKAR